MTSSIGFMIGFYVVTRMVSVLTSTGRRVESLPVKLLALVTIIVTILAMASLMISGITSIPT